MSHGDPDGCTSVVLLFIVCPILIVLTIVMHLRLSEIRDRIPAPMAEKKP